MDTLVARSPLRLEPDQPLFIASLVGISPDLELQHEPAIFSARDMVDAQAYCEILCADRFPGSLRHHYSIADLQPNLRLANISWPE